MINQKNKERVLLYKLIHALDSIGLNWNWVIDHYMESTELNNIKNSAEKKERKYIMSLIQEIEKTVRVNDGGFNCIEWLSH